eukprot:Awhi_evm1s1801
MDLTEEQKQRMTEKRQAALEKRRSRRTQPYNLPSTSNNVESEPFDLDPPQSPPSYGLEPPDSPPSGGLEPPPSPPPSNRPAPASRNTRSSETTSLPATYYPSRSKAASSNTDMNNAQNRRRPFDTEAGFILEEEEAPVKYKVVDFEDNKVYVPDGVLCKVCNESFPLSFLYTHFQYPVCNPCKKLDREEGENFYALITKTTAKTEYLVVDHELDEIKFMLKKNPRGGSFACMKLYLACQVEEISFKKWGSEDGLDAELDRRKNNKIEQKKKKQEKQLTELRKKTRVNLKLKKKQDSIHVHDYGEESYDEEKDEYSQICKT